MKHPNHQLKYAIDCLISYFLPSGSRNSIRWFNGCSRWSYWSLTHTQIRKSKVRRMLTNILTFFPSRLALGNILLDVSMGTRGGFLQELASLRTTPNGDDISPSSPTLTILGHLSHRLNCTLDFDSLGLHTDR